MFDVLAAKIRLTEQNAGYIQIKRAYGWMKVYEEKWNNNRLKMLCEHLGFEETEGNSSETRQLTVKENLLAGDLMCYNTKPNRTSCCIHLKVFRTSPRKPAKIPYVKCKNEQR